MVANTANGAHRFKQLFINDIKLPFIDLIEETAKTISHFKLNCVGLVGVKETMSGNFYQDALMNRSISCITPSESIQDEIHNIIYSELLDNRISKKSREKMNAFIKGLQDRGAEGIILGCTELPIFFGGDSEVKLFSTTNIHCESIIDAMLSG